MKAIKLLLYFSLLGILLASCFSPPNKTPVLTEQSVSSTTPANNARLTSVRSLVINYASAVDRASAEQALTLYTGDYDPTQNPATFTKLTLASVCDGYWRVNNPNLVPISFNWDIEGSSEKAVGVAQPGNTYFYSSKGPKTLRVLVGTALQQKKAQVATVCTTQGARTFTWDAGSVKLTQTFGARPLGKYTIVVSTGLTTTTGTQPASPYISKFSVIRNPNLPKISLSSPIAFGGGGFNFEAYGAGVDGSTYSWNFGDGTSQTGEAVYKTYTNPGLYTVTLSVTSPTGKVTTAKTIVAQHKNIHDAPNTRANGSSKTFTFDAGANLPGFVYQWSFGDGKSAIGSKVTKTYTSLGFKDVELKVIDNRTEEAKLMAQGYTEAEIEELKAEGLLGDLEAQAVTPVVAAIELTRVNAWKTKPNAKFTATSPQLVAGDITAGNVPVTISFNASTSTSSSTATYTWDFGDGSATATGVTTSHTYTTAGRYLVTLTVKDADNQVDTANTLVFALNDGVKISTLQRYTQITPGLIAGLEAESADLQSGATLQAANAEEAQATLAQASLEPQQTATFVSYYPYVVDRNTSFSTAQFFPLGTGSFIYTAMQSFVNGVQKPIDGSGGPFTGGCYNQTPGTNATTLCRALTFANGIIPKPLAVGINTVQVINSSQLFELQYQAFAGLRVPRVVISILPDEQVPGDMASPILTENTVTVGGNTELMLQVNIRKSEATSGFAEFEVPVYAVNSTGSQLSNFNGLFRARFNALPDSETVDGVMVNGKAYIKVKIPLATYANGSTQLDLTQMKVHSAPSCDAASFYQLPTNYPTGLTVPVNFTVSLFGCNTVTASYNAPTGSPVPAYAYTLPADYLSRTNRVYLGRDVAEQTKYDNNLKDVSGKVATFVIGFIPILGDSLDLLGQVYNTAIGQQVDPVLATLASAGLVLDIFTGGAGDITSIFKGGYKLSLQLAQEGVGGVLAIVIRDQAQNLISGAITARQFVDTLADRLKGVMDIALTPSCAPLGLGCLGKYDGAAQRIKSSGALTDSTALTKLDDGLNDAKNANIDSSCYLRGIVDAVGDYPIADAGILFAGLAPSQITSSLLEPLASPTSCGYAKFRGNIAGKNKTLYNGIPTKELDELAPHHLVPRTDNRSINCLQPATSVNICDKARSFLADAGLDIDDATNGVLLPWAYKHADAKHYTTFKSLYPNAKLHNGQVHSLAAYGKIHDSLKAIRDTFPATLTQQQKDQLKQQITTKLKEIAQSMLNGSF